MKLSDVKEYPAEFYFPFDSEPFHLGRVTINQLNSSYTAEIDIVMKESKKIFHHVDILYQFDDPRDALERATQRLSSFLKKQNAE